MASPVWTLVLLVGGLRHTAASDSAQNQKSLEWKVIPHGSRGNSVLTQCDFEDDSKPLCDWSQVSADDGDWIRASGPSPTGTTGPPGGYPNGDGYYLHMDSSHFPQGGVARLRSPDLWEQGPLCVHFAYHMFGLSWGAQLRLLLLAGNQGKRPNVLWKHVNTQSPSWMPTVVTMPAELALPSRLIFEGTRGSTAYLDIALDALSIHRGTCNHVCVTQMCNFDTRNDLCGWSWVPTASGAKWIQKKGSSGQPGVGPQDDFSNPGNGFYMLLDPKNAKPRQKSVLLSPLSQSAGCLTLSFHYTLWGQSPGAALSVLASVLGSIRKHTLFSGQPSPNWQPVSVNYSAPGQIQFTVVGVFGDVPEPAVAVDAISIAPCGESFPQCIFEDAAHPFCDWLQASEDGGRWAWADKDMLVQDRSLVRESPHTGHHYIYLEADKFSRAGQSVRLVSRPFCAPGDVCVEFSYHMYGLGEGTTLQFLLGSPAGSTPVSLWNCVGSQSPDWLNASVTILSGHQQPMQLVFEAIRGSNTAFVVAMSFILINHGTCHVPVPPVIKTSVIPTEQPTVPAEGTTKPPEGTIELPEGTTELPEEITEPPKETTKPPKETTISTEETTVPTEPPTVPTEKPTVPTEKPTVPTEETSIPTEPPTVPTEKPTVATEPPTVPTEKPTVATEPPTVPTEKPTVATEKPAVPTEETTPPTTARSTLTSLEPTTHPPSTSLTNTTLTTTTTPSPATVSCPANAHYESCACPASCEHPKASCKPPCQPGCVCDPGLVFSNNSCIKASSCPCLYNNNDYKPEAEWFSPNCTELCHCWPGGRIECQISQCKTHTKCQLKNGQYKCQPYGKATCFVYGDPHYVTFDGRHFSFMGKCTYIVAQPCSKSTDSFFRVTAKNEERGQEGVSCLSRVDVTLSETVVTLLKGRRTLVGGQRVTLPAMPAKGVFLGPSGRFVELQTDFGLRVRWDGDQQLLVTVPSAYFQKLCGLCGNYDGNSSNDNLKADGQPAQSEDELGNSWQSAQDEDKECQKNQANPPSCDTALQTKMSGPQFCGQLVDLRGVFETCLLHLKASSFFDNCVFDTCNFQGLQLMLCAHMSAVTAACQDAGYAVKPWREPQFCPLACPPNSRYSLCTSPCPKTCHTGYVGMSCPEQCLEGCECNPGFILSGLECVPTAQCGCLDPSRGYFQVGEQWFKSDCKQLCICEGSNQIRCQPWKCGPHEVCIQQSGIYGCHSQGSATCSASGDPHYLTFDGALHHFMGTCNYVLTQPCRHRPQENSFVVSATNEIRGGNLEVSYVRAVHVQVFNLKISLVKGHKVVLNGRRVSLPVWPSRGQVTVRPSGNFMLLYTNFGLRVRYDGNHLVEVTVPSSYAGQLCGLCGNYNNNSLDDILSPYKRPAGNSVQLGAAWKLEEGSETGCFLEGGKPSSCHEDMGDTWNKNCEVLMNPLGPFSQCHKVVPPEVSFTSCVRGQCGTKGDSLTLCRSLQAYASLCALAGQALAWRNSTFCPLKCPPNSSYSPCGSPCPGTCLSLNHPKDCPITLPCVEGCECQKGYILSGTSCVPLNQCGCTDTEGSYHLVGESWYTDNTCTRLCTCSLHNNITCRQTACKPGQQCWAVDGLLHCRDLGMGVCQVTGDSRYLSFDGSSHPLQGACTYVLAKVCHPNMDLPFFKVSASNEKSSAGGTNAVSLHQVYIEFSGSLVTLQKGNLVLINGTRVALPATSQIRGLSISSSRTHTIVRFWIGAQIKFDGSHVLEITIPAAYYEKVCGICGNYNGEPEDELMMPSDELAASDLEFVKSWKDGNIDPNCQKSQEGKGKPQEEQGPSRSSKKASCSPTNLQKVQEQCQAALQTPAWAECASRVDLRPFVLDCMDSLCQFRGSLQPLCKALQALGAACQSKGLKPPIWRNSSFCPLACPTYSTYTNCLPSCSPSCFDPDGRCEGARAPSTCAEGCTCQPGYVLSKNKCVAKDQCGCRDAQGGSVPSGKSWISSGCNQKCACTEGTIQCHAFHCPSRSHCKLNSNGNSNCVSEKSDQCSIFGGLHYRTFDRFSFGFRGRMTYVLIKTVDELPDGVERLLVQARNKMHPPWNKVFLQEIITTVYGYKVQLQKDLVLVVNNQKMAVPYKPEDRLRVSMQGQQLSLITDFQMVVSFDGRNAAVITLPSMYQGLVRGLCGNYDSDRRNEMMLPSGAITINVDVFGNSWEVKTEDSVLRFRRALQVEADGKEKEPGSYRSECSQEQLALVNSTQACRVLVDPQGPFAACHQTVAPEPFQEHCMSDLCAARDPKEHEELRCQVLSGYSITCQEAGIALAGWRDHTHCAMVCPANTVYQSCMTPCPESCANLAAPRDCEGPCVEGCASLPGYAFSGAQSLPLANCGCTSNGIYYQLGHSFVTADCSQRCTCASSGVLLCEPFSCRPGESCTLGNLTRGCFRESPCLRNPCQNDGRCREQGTSFTCECEPGYGGHLCTEPRDVPLPPKPDTSNLVAILLGMLVSLVFTVPVLARKCVSRKRRRWREKTQSLSRDRLLGAG